MAAQKPKAIRMKERIASDVRTDGKDDAAQQIQEKILDKGRWPMNYTDIAEEIGWSRQHVVHTLEDYFVEVDNGYETKPAKTDGNGEEPLRGQTLSIPDDVENVDDYLRGVRAGLNL